MKRFVQTGAVALLGAVFSCILPPPVAVENANSPPSVNYEESIPLNSNLHIDRKCRKCTLQIKVEDTDASDIIWLRGFLDHDNSIQCEVTSNTADGSARPPLQCDIDPSNMFKMAPLGVARTLEVFISDDGFVSTVADGARTPKDTAKWTIARWTITPEDRGLICDDRENLGCK